MRLNDIIESKQLDELNLGGVTPRGQTSAQPQGILGKLKLGAQQYLNPNSNVRARAKGISSVAKDANSLMTQYQEWVGRTYPDQGTTKENLIDWLTQQGLPVTGRVNALLTSISPPAAQAQPSATATATPPTAQPAAPTATPPAQPNLQALKGRLRAGQGLGQRTPGGFNNYVGGSGQRIQGANPNGSPRVVNIQREDQINEAVTPIDNKMVSQIISAAVAERNRAGGGAQPASVIPQGQPNTGTGSSSSRSSSMPTAQMTVSSVVNFYKRLNATGRQQLRAELDKIDKTPVPESTVDVDSVGYSRFLEIKL